MWLGKRGQWTIVRSALQSNLVEETAKIFQLARVPAESPARRVPQRVQRSDRTKLVVQDAQIPIGTTRFARAGIGCREEDRRQTIFRDDALARRGRKL